MANFGQAQTATLRHLDLVSISALREAFVVASQRLSQNLLLLLNKYINHTFHYPGRVEWENVTITIVDPVDPNAASSAAQLLKIGYHIPGNENSPPPL